MIDLIADLLNVKPELSYSFDWFGWGVSIRNSSNEYRFDARDVSVSSIRKSTDCKRFVLEIKTRDTGFLVCSLSVSGESRNKLESLEKALKERCYNSLEAERRELAITPIMKDHGTVISLSFQDANWTFNKKDVRGISSYLSTFNIAENGSFKTVEMRVVKISLTQRRVIKLQIEDEKSEHLNAFQKTFAELYADHLNAELTQ